MSITIYHNPKCGTSRNTLRMIRESGSEPQVIEYLKTPPTRETLVKLIADMGVGVRPILRKRGTPYDEFELDSDRFSDDELIDFIIEHPILMNRPIVVSPKGTKLCRPCEEAFPLLENEEFVTFTKEDGTIVHR
ncbi:arsenate reductase (glutaredoxin) [Flexibacterium corallicola]|uniref:arsenate reductase (glutaredoxin) n=1 Tax=Flexibacterium corallicola TaxID=3037259 RepID=UPI00286F0FF8|nr:arsenate reductase (glutaredoxin) [Pseudovibrio sp. M1P-2-3]